MSFDPVAQSAALRSAILKAHQQALTLTGDARRAARLRRAKLEAKLASLISARVASGMAAR